MDNILECKVYVYCGFGWLGGIKVINFCVLFVMIFGFKIKNVFIMIVLLISRYYWNILYMYMCKVYEFWYLKKFYRV